MKVTAEKTDNKAFLELETEDAKRKIPVVTRVKFSEEYLKEQQRKYVKDQDPSHFDFLYTIMKKKGGDFVSEKSGRISGKVETHLLELAPGCKVVIDKWNKDDAPKFKKKTPAAAAPNVGNGAPGGNNVHFATNVVSPHGPPPYQGIPGYGVYPGMYSGPSFYHGTNYQGPSYGPTFGPPSFHQGGFQGVDMGVFAGYADQKRPGEHNDGGGGKRAATQNTTAFPNFDVTFDEWRNRFNLVRLREDSEGYANQVAEYNAFRFDTM